MFRGCNLQSVPSVLFRSLIHALICVFASGLHVLCSPIGWSGRHELFPPTAWPCPSQFQVESLHSQPFFDCSITCLVFWCFIILTSLPQEFQKISHLDFHITVNKVKLKAQITLTGLLLLPLEVDFYAVVQFSFRKDCLCFRWCPLAESQSVSTAAFQLNALWWVTKYQSWAVCTL